MSHIAIYPGSFDPITLGHLDIIQRSLELVDELIIAVGVNPSKTSFFSIDERTEMVRESVAALPSDKREAVRVEAFDGLLVHFAQQKKAQTIIRGLRAVSDFEYEFQMAAMNRKLHASLETLFLMASDHTQFIASRYVKEIARMQGDVSQFVTPAVQARIQGKLQEESVA